MRKLLALAFLLVSSVAWGANFPIHERLANSIFPVELGGIEYNAQENYSIVHGRAFNNTGVEQNDVGMTLTLYRDGAPVHNVTTDLGHMFDKTFAFFNIMVRGMDLRDSNSYGVDLKSGLHDRLYTQSPDIWHGHVNENPAIAIPVHGDAMFPIERLHVDPNRFHQGSKIEGLIHNISSEELTDAWFRLVFYDNQAKPMDSLRIHVPHMGPGHSVVFTGNSRRDDLNQWSSYVLQRETRPVVAQVVDQAVAAQRQLPPVPQARYVDPNYVDNTVIGGIGGNIAAPAPAYAVQAPAYTVQAPAVTYAPAPVAVAQTHAGVVGTPTYAMSATAPVYVASAPGQVAMSHTYVSNRHDYQLDSLRITHDGDRAVEVRGQITNHSGHNLTHPTHFTAVFFDEGHTKTGSMNFVVRHLTNGDTEYFRTTHTQGNFNNTHRYQLYID